MAFASARMRWRLAGALIVLSPYCWQRVPVLVSCDIVDITPSRNEQFRSMAGSPPTARWIAAGYDPIGTPSYLSALSRSVEWSTNSAAILQFPNITQVFWNMTTLASEVSTGNLRGHVLRCTCLALHKPFFLSCC
jgi:hypothetical protein